MYKLGLESYKLFSVPPSTSVNLQKQTTEILFSLWKFENDEFCFGVIIFSFIFVHPQSDIRNTSVKFW